MSPQTQQFVHLLASLAGSALLALVFVMLVGVCVLLWLSGRGLKLARKNVALLAAQILEHVTGAEAIARTEARALIEPQIGAVSALAGLQAGTRALLRGGAPGEVRPAPIRKTSVGTPAQAPDLPVS
jgi:hypothetical protein